MAVLQTKRLTLRRFTGADHGALCLLFSDPVAMEFYLGTRDADATRTWLDRMLRSYRTHGYGHWAALLHDGSLAGHIGLLLQEVDGENEIEVGYMIRRELWGRGLAGEGAAACVEYAFDRLGAGRVIALIRPDNHRSRSVAEKLGMILEKTTRKWDMTLEVWSLEAPRGESD